jgi:hypothetical protein
MSKKTDKKLVLKKESLRTLETTELEAVNGGAIFVYKSPLTYCCLGQGGGGGGCAPAPNG